MKDRLDLHRVVTDFLGEPARRVGSRPAWHCPFHDDRNPSFTVDDRGWRCWACGIGGDAASFVMRLEGVKFPEAARKLADLAGVVTPSGRPAKAGWGSRPASAGGRQATRTAPKPKSFARDRSSGLDAAEARRLVEEAEARLWSPEGRPAREYLVNDRGLTEATIRRHRLGWTPGDWVPTADGLRYWKVAGAVIPWFDAGRLVRVKVRQPKGREPRYAEVFADHPGAYPDLAASPPVPGRALVVVEGEFEAMLLGQALDGLANVMTSGGSSSRPDDATRNAMRTCPRWLDARDADPSGEKAAGAWASRAVRVRPPAGKDWTEARSAGVDLRRWWVENHFPEEFGREERAAIMECDGGLDRDEAEARCWAGKED